MKHFYLLALALICALTSHAQYTLTADDVAFNEETGTITAYHNRTEKDIIIPESINGVKVKVIGFGAFYSEQLVSVVIPESVTEIADAAFSINQLSSINIPSSVTKIGFGAFSINQLTSVNLPNSVTNLGWGAFRSNKLTSISIPSSVTVIGDATFSMNELNHVDIPNSVTVIGSAAFAHNKLAEVTIPNSVTVIGMGAFAANELTSVDIPKSVTDIMPYAFASKSELMNFIGSDESEGEDISAHEYHLKKIKLHKKDENRKAIQWREYRFEEEAEDSILLVDMMETKPVITDFTKGYTTSTEELGGEPTYTITADDVVFDEQTGAIMSYTNANETDIAIPQSINGAEVKIIDTYAFASKKLTSIVIPNTVTSIESGAFFGNELSQVTIPNSVAKIAERAFTENKLTSIELPTKNMNGKRLKWYNDKGERAEQIDGYFSHAYSTSKPE